MESELRDFVNGLLSLAARLIAAIPRFKRHNEETSMPVIVAFGDSNTWATIRRRERAFPARSAGPACLRASWGPISK
jgi:hypothetical protein